jgi:hypothetical protein
MFRRFLFILAVALPLLPHTLTHNTTRHNTRCDSNQTKPTKTAVVPDESGLFPRSRDNPNPCSAKLQPPAPHPTLRLQHVLSADFIMRPIYSRFFFIPAEFFSHILSSPISFSRHCYSFGSRIFFISAVTFITVATCWIIETLAVCPLVAA